MDKKALDRVVYGGSIYAGKGSGRSVEAIGIKGGKIAAVGTLESLSDLCSPRTVRQDLSGKCMVPGFLDPHTHFSLSSLTPLMADCRTPPHASTEDILHTMGGKAARTTVGRWVVGWGYNEARLSKGTHPTVEEMDRACPDHPAVLIHASFHQCVLNSLAMALCGIDSYSGDLPGGMIARDCLGRPTGMLFERAFFRVFQCAWRDLIHQGRKEAKRLFTDNGMRHLRLGIVRLADAGVGSLERQLYSEISGKGASPLRIDFMEVGEEGLGTAPTHLFKTAAVDGNVSTVKLFMDGARQCALEFPLLETIVGGGRLAARAFRRKTSLTGMRDLRYIPKRIDRSGKLHMGFFLNDPGEIEAIVEEAHRLGYPVATHALGNAAVSRILDVYERVQDRLGVPRRPFRIEHALFVTTDLILRMARLNVAAVVQPSFIYEYGPLLKSQPLPRSVKVLPLREMMDRGVVVSGSSDEPCGREDPLWAMECAVCRKTPDGECMNPEQAISSEEALKLYTINAARVMGCEEELGSLEQGKKADCVILSKDPFRHGFHEVKVVETLVDGIPV